MESCDGKVSDNINWYEITWYAPIDAGSFTSREIKVKWRRRIGWDGVGKGAKRQWARRTVVGNEPSYQYLCQIPHSHHDSCGGGEGGSQSNMKQHSRGLPTDLPCTHYKAINWNEMQRDEMRCKILYCATIFDATTSGQHIKAVKTKCDRVLWNGKLTMYNIIWNLKIYFN